MFIPYKKFRGDALYVLEYMYALEVFTSVWRDVFNRSKDPDNWATADLACDKAMSAHLFPVIVSNGYSDRKVCAWHQAWRQARKDMLMSWESF
jgi:hypothetical protein